MAIINSWHRGGKDLPRVPKPVVTFCRTMETFISVLPGYQNFLPQALTSSRYSTCSYLRTDKKQK